MRDAQSPRLGFKLDGEVDGERRSFALAEGPQSLGSSRSAAIHLAVKGVSRLHAELDVGADRVSLRDNGSRNGTFVNGRRLAEGETATLSLGDRLRFGPVLVTLEHSDAEEGMIGLRLDPPSLGGPLEATLETLALTEEEPLLVGSLNLLATIVELLTLPQSDLQAVADRLRDAAGLEAVAIFERTDRTLAPMVLAASGDVEALSSLSRPEHAPEGNCLVLDEVPIGLFARALAGHRPPRSLLEGALRIVRCLHSAPTAVVTEQDSEGNESARRDPARPRAELRLPNGIVKGRSPAMLELYQQAALVARSDLPVLLLGETGVGKEHLAEAIHLSSARRDGPFAVVNCAAIPAEQLEAEMFGIGKGVATGVSARPGCFVRAEGGTLFLDEAGEMPVTLQAKLLRALQQGQIHPVGLPPRKVDVRVVAATNADLDANIADGQFRADLYYRLAGAELVVPPLRRRHEDLGALMAFFLGRAAKETQTPVRGLSVKALRLLSRYSWPGNVRELEHEMRRLALRSRPHQAIDSTLLSPRILTSGDRQSETELGQLDAGQLGLEARLDALQSSLINQALEATAGNQTRAASKLGLSRSGLIKRMKRLGIDAKAYSEP